MRVFSPTDRLALSVPGRQAWDIVSGRTGAQEATLRYVEIPPAGEATSERRQHLHRDVEEVMWVISGEGLATGADGSTPVSAGCVIHVPANEPHMTRNVGREPLRMVCFFPTADIGSRTEEPV